MEGGLQVEVKLILVWARRREGGDFKEGVTVWSSESQRVDEGMAWPKGEITSRFKPQKNKQGTCNLMQPVDRTRVLARAAGRHSPRIATPEVSAKITLSSLYLGCYCIRDPEAEEDSPSSFLDPAVHFFSPDFT